MQNIRTKALLRDTTLIYRDPYGKRTLSGRKTVRNAVMGIPTAPFGRNSEIASRSCLLPSCTEVTALFKNAEGLLVLITVFKYFIILTSTSIFVKWIFKKVCEIKKLSHFCESIKAFIKRTFYT